MVCGEALILWDTLVEFSLWISLKGQALRNVLDLTTVVRISTAMLPYQNKSGETFKDFLAVLTQAMLYRASDPRDYIYAFLSHPAA